MRVDEMDMTRAAMTVDCSVELKGDPLAVPKVAQTVVQ